MKYTVPQPFSLATDKRASIGVQPIDVAANDMNKHMGARGTPSSSVPKKDKMVVKLDTQVAYHPLLSKDLHLHDQNVNPSKQVNMKLEEDAHSSFSSTASAKSIRDSKGKSGSAPSGVGFSFRCNERAYLIWLGRSQREKQQRCRSRSGAIHRRLAAKFVTVLDCHLKIKYTEPVVKRGYVWSLSCWQCLLSG